MREVFFRFFVISAACAAAPGCHEGGAGGPCADVTCSGHGTCIEEGSTATCECNHGYQPEGLECVPVETDGDSDVDSDADSDVDSGTDADADLDGDGGDGDRDAAEDADPDSDGGVPPTVFCDELVALVCRGHMSCCPSPDYADEDACVAAMISDCDRGIGVVVNYPPTRYDPLLARTLLDEGWTYVEGPGACDPEIAPWLVERERLFSALRGSLAEATTCVSTAADAFRLESYFTCEYDLSCRLHRAVPVDATCDPRAGEGMPCRGHFTCQTGLYCDGYSLGVDGTCRPALGTDAACDVYLVCESYLCEGGLCLERTVENVFCANPFAMMEP